MMNRFAELFAPSGCEAQMRECLKKVISSHFDEVRIDNMGNLAAISGDGSFCIECGMDTRGIMAVTEENNEIRFAPVGKITVKDLIDKRVVFENGASGTVYCDSDTEEKSAKLSDLYVSLDEGRVKVGDFAAVAMEFSEDDDSFSGYGLRDRVAMLAVLNAIKKTGRTENITVLFSAQKCLGARGLRAFFGANSFKRVLLTDYCDEVGCIIVAKDERVVSEPKWRKELEGLAEKTETDVHTAVADKNFCIDQVITGCGAPCAAFGIPVIFDEGEADRVSKSDFETAVSYLSEILDGGI